MPEAGAVREVADALSKIPLFAGLGERVVAGLAENVRRVEVEAGEVVIRRGEPGDCLFVVHSGLLEVLDLADETRVRLLRPGNSFGELALLARQPRIATCRSVRDSVLWQVPSEAFEALLDRDADFPRAMVHALTALVFESRLHAETSQPTESVFAIVPLHDDAPVDVVVDGFRATVPSASLRVVRGGEHQQEAWARTIEELEQTCPFVVLVASATRDAWFDFCVREADRVVAVARPDEQIAPLAAPARIDLLLIGNPRAGQVGRALEVVSPRAHHVLAGRDPVAEISRAVRRLVGTSIGIVLSGGGARGLAHVGVLQALADANVVIDRYGGTSMGALVGALGARGLSPPAMLDVLRRELVERHPFNDWAVPRVALIRARRAREMLERTCGASRIEELAYNYFCISADLASATPVVHRLGPLARAVGASMSLPGLAPPVRDGDRLLVDGGVLDNLPVEVMVDADEGPVIAVDVMARGLPGARRRGRVDRTDRLPSMIETLARATTLSSRAQAIASRELAAHTIVPDLRDIALLEFGRFDEIIDAGRLAAEQALADGLADLTQR